MTVKSMMMIENRLKTYPFLQVFYMVGLGSFADFTLFSVGYFATKNMCPGSRKYIYLILCNCRICIGIQWW
jgi:hypothetical protein